jgi:hypothetical protein
MTKAQEAPIRAAAITAVTRNVPPELVQAIRITLELTGVAFPGVKLKRPASNRVLA